jgi:hypothetical protein
VQDGVAAARRRRAELEVEQAAEPAPEGTVPTNPASEN